VFATEATAALVGLDLDALRGRLLLEFVHPDDRDRVVAEMARVQAGEPSERRRYRIERPDGCPVWVDAAATPYVLDGRDATLVVIEDVTARLAAEEALRTSELRHRTLVQRSADIVTILTTT